MTYANMTPAVGHKYQFTDRDLAPLAALDHLEELVIGDTPITDGRPGVHRRADQSEDRWSSLE